MKGSRQEIKHAERIKRAVDAIVFARGGTSQDVIEEAIGINLDDLPKDIRPLDQIPETDAFEFIGFDADFNAIECRQDLIGQKLIVNSSVPIVGWMPKKKEPLAGGIGKITAKNGLLWQFGQVIPLPRADSIAIEAGFTYAERYVKALEKRSSIKSKIRFEISERLHRIKSHAKEKDRDS